MLQSSSTSTVMPMARQEPSTRQLKHSSNQYWQRFCTSRQAMQRDPQEAAPVVVLVAARKASCNRQAKTGTWQAVMRRQAGSAEAPQ